VKSINLIELAYLSTLEIIGEGAIDLLQGQITSDMGKVTDSRSCLGALCNIKGRVASSFLIVKKPRLKDAFLLIGNREVMKTTQEILKKYSPFYKLEMKLNDDYKFIAINEDFLSQTFSETDLNLSIQNHKNFLRIHYLQKKFHLLLLEMNTNYFKNLEVSDDLSEWERDNIINKDFNIEAKDSNKYTPHELGYHQTNRIDFEKGCYTGQEIVARMHYRAKKLPFLIIGSLDTKESVSTEVFNEEDKKVGSILSKAKQANSNLFLLSMNKNYDNEEIKFKDSSFISLK
jgi:hypothetical protein